MIRSVKKEDYKKVEELIVEAFSKSEHGYNGEVDIVKKVRELPDYSEELELVYLEDGEIVGHALLSSTWILDKEKNVIKEGLVLAPISVIPDKQGQGIGGKLIEALEQLTTGRIAFISILGNPLYYGRFGYKSASEYSVKAPFDVPEEYFMIKELSVDELLNSEGTLKYNQAFD